MWLELPSAGLISGGVPPISHTTVRSPENYITKWIAAAGGDLPNGSPLTYTGKCIQMISLYHFSHTIINRLFVQQGTDVLEAHV